MAYSSLWGAPIKVKLKADEGIQEYVPALAENEIVTGIEIVKLEEDNLGCTIEINDRKVWLSEKEANRIYVDKLNQEKHCNVIKWQFQS